MLTIRIAIGADWFECSDDEATLTDARPLVDQWYTARTDAHAQEAINRLTEQAKRDNDALGASVTDNTPIS